MHPGVRGAYHGFLIHVMVSLGLAAFSDHPFNYLCGTAIATGAAVGVTWLINRRLTHTKENQWA